MNDINLHFVSFSSPPRTLLLRLVFVLRSFSLLRLLHHLLHTLLHRCFTWWPVFSNMTVCTLKSVVYFLRFLLPSLHHHRKSLTEFSFRFYRIWISKLFPLLFMCLRSVHFHCVRIKKSQTSPQFASEMRQASSQLWVFSEVLCKCFTYLFLQEK